MKISVMFITYNRKKELLRAIDSCMKCYMEGIEFIIVDNNSSDGTKYDVENKLNSYGVPYTYHYSNENLGISEGRNVAFSLCSGEYVFCLDDDAIIGTDNFFETIYNKMKKHSNAVAAAVEIFEPSSNKYLKGYTYEKNGTKYALSYIGAAHILKRESFIGRNLYPREIKFGSEEAYIAYRVRKMDKEILYIDDVRVLHLPSKVARVYGNERKFNIIINYYIIRKLCYPIYMIPILRLILKLRIYVHNLNGEYPSSKVNDIINTRYNKLEVDRMSTMAFLKMIADVGIRRVI